MSILKINVTNKLFIIPVLSKLKKSLHGVLDNMFTYTYVNRLIQQE